MNLIKTSNKLPKIKKGKINQRLNKKKLLEAAGKVREVLKRERRLTVYYDEDFSFRRGAIGH